MIRSLPLAAAVVFAFLASGCASRTVPIGIKVITRACSGPSPTAGVDHYRVRVSAPDISPPIEQAFKVGAASPLAAIPAGTQRVAAVFGYRGDPAKGGTVVSYGQSLPFDVPNAVDPGAPPVTATVILRAAGQFSGATTAADPSQCAQLQVARAGHAATLLADGRVLFTGGFSVKPDAVDNPSQETNWVMHQEAEIYDPATGAVSPAAAMSLGGSFERAFHTATLLRDGTVLVAGGEVVPSGGGLFTQSNALLYDPASDSWPASGLKSMATDAQSAQGRRSRHVAVTDDGGRVLLLGGEYYCETRDDTCQQGSAQLVSTAAWYDPATRAFHPADASVSFARVGLAAAPVLGGAYLFAAGGTDSSGNFASPDLAFFRFDPNAQSFTEITQQQLALAHDRSGLAGATFGPAGDRVLLAGGHGAPDGGDPLASSELLDFSGNAPQMADVADASAARADPCAVTLRDGRVLNLGGDVAGGAGEATVANADLYALDPASGSTRVQGTGPLQTSRKWHTCTALQDGTVLVVGGVEEAPPDQPFRVLNSIEIYTPMPAP